MNTIVKSSSLPSTAASTSSSDLSPKKTRSGAEFEGLDPPVRKRKRISTKLTSGKKRRMTNERKERTERFEDMLLDFDDADLRGRTDAGCAAVKMVDFVDGVNEEDYDQPFKYACEWKEKFRDPRIDSRIPFDPQEGRIVLTHKHEKPTNTRTCDCIDFTGSAAHCVSRKFIKFVNNQLRDVLSQSRNLKLSYDVQRQGEEGRELATKVCAIETRLGDFQEKTNENIQEMKKGMDELMAWKESLNNQTKHQQNGANKWSSPVRPQSQTTTTGASYTDRRPPLVQAKCSTNDIANALAEYDQDPVIATIRIVAKEHPTIIEDTINKMNFRLKERLFSDAMKHNTYGPLLRATNKAVKDYLNETAAVEIYERFKYKSIIVRSELKVADTKNIPLMARRLLMTVINEELKKWKIQETIDEEDIDWGNVEDITETSVKIWITGKEMTEERINNKALRCYALMVHNDAIQSKLIYKSVEDIMEKRKKIDYDSRPKKVIETMSDPRYRPVCHTCGIKGHTATYCGRKKTI